MRINISSNYSCRFLSIALCLIFSLFTTPECQAAARIITIAGSGYSQYNGDGQRGLDININPTGCMLLKPDTDELYFVDGETRIRKVDMTTTQVTTVAGSGSREYNGDYYNIPLAININPVCKPNMAFHPTTKDLYFNDGMSRVRVVRASGPVEWVAGTGHTALNDNFPNETPNIIPHGIEINQLTGGLYINDRRSRIRNISATGEIRTIAGEAPHWLWNTNEFGSMAFHPQTKELYYVVNDRMIYKLNSSNNKVELVAGTKSKEWNGNFLRKNTNINPTGQFLFNPNDLDELVFIDGESRIRKVNISNNVSPPTTIAGTGNKEWNSDHKSPDCTNINPLAMAFSPVSGELFFNDGGSRIRKITQTGLVQTVAGTGNKWYSDQSTKPLETNIAPYGGLIFNNKGDLFFADADDADDKTRAENIGRGHTRIRVLTLSEDG